MSFPTARIADPALRYETRMFLQDIKIFVDVVTLSPSNVKSKALDWHGDIGFFDKCALIARGNYMDRLMLFRQSPFIGSLCQGAGTGLFGEINHPSTP
jgi:hypothetical protein